MDHEEEIDFIPLAEVASIDEMCAIEDVDDDQSQPREFSIRKAKQRAQSGRDKIFSSARTNASAEADPDPEGDEGTSQLFVNAFQVATVQGGYNSGRSYYLQADSGQVKQRLIAQLTDLARAARKRAEETTWLRRIQERVRAVYVHRVFQSAAAFLILAVRRAPRRDPPRPPAPAPAPAPPKPRARLRLGCVCGGGGRGDTALSPGSEMLGRPSPARRRPRGPRRRPRRRCFRSGAVFGPRAPAGDRRPGSLHPVEGPRGRRLGRPGARSLYN